MGFLGLFLDHDGWMPIVGNPGQFIRKYLDERYKPEDSDHDAFIAQVNRYCQELGLKEPWRIWHLYGRPDLTKEMEEFCHRANRWGQCQKAWRTVTHTVGINLNDRRSIHNSLTNVTRNAPVETINQIIGAALVSKAVMYKVYYEIPEEATKAYAGIITGAIPVQDYIKYIGLHDIVASLVADLFKK